MTLVARLVRHKFHFILGDALISAPNKASLPSNAKMKINAQLPMVTLGSRLDKEYDFQYLDHPPVGLMQKIVLIGDRIAFGWSGNVNVARRIVSSLREGLDGWKSVDDVWAAIEAISRDDRQVVKYLGLAVTGQGGCAFHNGASRVASKKFEYAEAIGSGTALLHKFLDESVGLPGSESSINETATSILALGAQMLNAELSSSITMEHAFGGAYEVVTAYGDKVVKYPAAIICYWQAEVGDEEVAISLRHMTRFHYIGEHLVVRSYHQQASLTTHQEIFVASPIDRALEQSELESVARASVDAKTHLVLSLISIFQGGEHVGTAIYSQGQGEKVYVTFEEGATLIRRELLVNIGEYVREREAEGCFKGK